MRARTKDLPARLPQTNHASFNASLGAVVRPVQSQLRRCCFLRRAAITWLCARLASIPLARL